jgi:MoaA/NifB/PqqE/SkfB family radical SAM enzyme
MIGNASKLFNYPDRLKAFWAGEPVVPVTVEIHPSDKCNQKCSYCPLPHTGAVMSRDFLYQALSECDAIGVEGVVLSGGGEPTIAGIDVASLVSIPCGLITNGATPLCPTMSPDSFWPTFRWVRFSVDSCRADTYEAIRGVPVPDCLQQNITEAVGQTFVGVQMVVCPENKNQCTEMAYWAELLGAKYLEIRPDEYTENPEWPAEDQLADAESVSGIDVIVRRDKIGLRQAGPCHAGHFSMTIGADGKCWVCACGELRFYIGDLNESSLKDIVFSDRRREVLEGIDATQCPSMCRGAAINAALSECEKHRQWF